MTTVRRGAEAVLRYLTPLLLALVVVQIFLAGYGVFGIEEGQGLEDAKDLDAHRALGHMVTTFGGLLLIILSLLWWPREKRLLGLYILTALLMFPIQVLLAEGGQWTGALHPVNAVLILGLLGYLSRVMWRRRGMQEPTPMAGSGATPM